jgi:T-complex protein 11
MNSAEIRRHMTQFLTDKTFNVIEQAKQYLVPLRRTVMDGYTLVESRCLWFSLILYKFRTESNISDELWTASRNFVLETLRQDPTRDATARHYLTIFDLWKKEDRTSFVNEVIGYYLEVLHLKQVIEESREESTIAEWKDSYQGLIYKIRDAAQKMGFLSALDERVAEVDRARHSIVENMMKRAYWDMIENDIREEKYTGVLCQLLELKELVKEVIPSRFHADLHEKFDIDFIQANLEQQTLDPTYLVQLCRWVMDSMKEWDSAMTRPLYDREIRTWEESIGTLEWPRFLRFSLEVCTLLALDAKTRVSIWRSLIRQGDKK